MFGIGVGVKKNKFYIFQLLPKSDLTYFPAQTQTQTEAFLFQIFCTDVGWNCQVKVKMDESCFFPRNSNYKEL
jgi:hypothetical protein